MTKGDRFTLLTLAILLALVFSSMQTVPVRADDTLPPPPATEEPIQPPVEEAAATETPVVTEEFEDPAAIGTVATPSISDPTEEPQPVVSEEETDSVAEVLEQLLEETTIVVLDDHGEALPLATQETANALIASDPMWCPTGQTPGGAGCTPAFATVTELIAVLGSYSGAGTIYFTPTYSTNDASFDQALEPNLANLTDLTIQGGWNGSSGAGYALSGASTFSVPLTVSFWNGNVTLNDLIVEGADSDRGVLVETSGDIELDNVDASDNGTISSMGFTGAGSILWAGGDIHITSSTFNGNGDMGLFAISDGSITLNDVEANNNIINYEGETFGEGAVLWAGGDIHITGSTFNGNGDMGLWAISDGSITLNNVEASNNTGDCFCSGEGAELLASGNISVTSSTFNNNASDGIEAYAAGNITLTDVIASNNTGNGAYLGSGNDITVQCSRSKNNGDYGVYAEMDGGTLTLNGNIFANNASGDIYLAGGTLVDSPGYICKVVSSSGKKSLTANGLPLNTIHVNGGEKNTLSCNGFSGTELILPNGDRVIIPCPNGDEASLDSVMNGDLPGVLDGNFTFVSGLEAAVDPALIGSMTVSFMIPAGQQDAEFTILHWDGTKWEGLGGYKSSDTFFKVHTGSTGIFVLASK